jgi:hypothetical protein
LVGAALQFTIAEALASANQGDAIRAGIGLLLE